MKREQARLHELRHLSYEDYLQTPEWQETQKAALKRAGNRCQMCRAGNVPLTVYHTTYKNLGCEQESDVLVLCEACYDVFAQRQAELSPEPTTEMLSQHPATPHFSFGKRALVFTPSAAIGVGLPALLHAPLPAEVFGFGAAIALAINSPKIYAELRDSLPAPLVELLDAQAERKRARAASGEWSNWDRLLGRHLRDAVPEQEDAEDTTIVDEEDLERDDQQEEEDEQSTAEDDLFTPPAAPSDDPAIKRITLAQMLKHTERNSYEVYLGRSLTLPGAPAIKVNFFKRHIKLIGASQHGKSSMAAALLEAIAATHDPTIVQFALLDLEDKTSRLLAHLPHVTRVRKHGENIRLHARSHEQVLEQLGYLLSLVEYRYSLSEEELERQPLLIVYIEEFIDLKDYFKLRVDAVEREEKEQAKRDYARLIYCIKQLARRGLKVYVQLLLCAQVDYRDDDLQEALVNITSGMSFCVRPSAAQAAGFYQTELITRNARENKLGQAVVEMPDCKDLILAPEYDLRARLKALAQAQKRPQAAAQPVVELALMEADEEDEALRERPLAPEAAKITLLPARAEQKPQPKLKDAIACWNELVEAGQNPSRNNLQQALIAKGFECRENWARKFYEDIRDMLPKADTTSVGG
jgi:hypothetical protein